jgi:hypothetical protein
MTVILCLFVWIVCLGLACWADLDAQKHISKGLDDAWKQVQKDEA